MSRLARCFSLVVVSHLAAALAPANAAVHPVYAHRELVVSGEPAATDVGVAVLEAGGNAFDAAAAVGFALAVTHPLAGNVGGGGFCVARRADGSTLALDFRETAPAAASRDMYLDDDGEADTRLSRWTHLAVGVPGTVDGLLRLHAEHGVLPRSRVLEPAIALARGGCTVSPFLHFAIAQKRARLEPFAESAARFLPEGEPLAIGDTLVQADLATTLEAVLRDGRAGFYEGDVAGHIVRAVSDHGGILTREDLRGYRARFREPFTFGVEDLELVTHPLPSSGGIALAQMLGMLDLDALRRAGWNSAEYARRLTEAARLAFADRSHYLGDPAFADVPVERLVSTEYLAARARRMPAAGAGRSDTVSAGVLDAGETTHFTVADRHGNVVAITYTINAWFGMGAIVPGAGFFLNNEMDDFSAKPGAPNLYGLVGTEANAIAAEKRPLSSMTPTIVLRSGDFRLTVGSPGGSRIITTVLQVFLNCTLFDMNIREAIDAPRFHHQWLPDRIEHEPQALSPDTQALLVEMGYELHDRGRDEIGRAMGILRTDDGLLTGWADRRSTGKAAGN